MNFILKMKIKPVLIMRKINALRPKGQVLVEWPFVGMIMSYFVRWAKTFFVFTAEVLR